MTTSQKINELLVESYIQGLLDMKQIIVDSIEELSEKLIKEFKARISVQIAADEAMSEPKEGKNEAQS